MITSKTNQQLKKVRKLLTSAKERRESGLFVVEGVRICSEVPKELLETVFLSADCKLDSAGIHKFRTALDHPGEEPGMQDKPELKISVEVVESSLFRDLSDTVNPQGILAVVRKPNWDAVVENLLEDKRLKHQEKLRGLSRKSEGTVAGAAPSKLLLLDGIRDPGNLGTIIRTAEAAGVGAVFLSPDCVDLYNPKVTRSTMGSIFRVPAVTTELLPVMERLRTQGVPVYGTSLEATCSYKDVDLTGAAVIIGSEANGISAPVMEAATQLVRIPMAGQVESLNAAVSAAILMFC